MKKGLIVMTALSCVLLLAGCGNKEQKLTCTLDKNDVVTGYKLTTKYEATAKGNKLTTVKTTETVESDSQDVLDYFKEATEESYNKMNDTYGGYTFTTKSEGKKLVVNTTIDYTKLDQKKLAADEPAMKQYMDKNNNMTLDGIQKVYEAMGSTCKKN